MNIDNGSILKGHCAFLESQLRQLLLSQPQILTGKNNDDSLDFLPKIRSEMLQVACEQMRGLCFYGSKNDRNVLLWQPNRRA